MQQSKASVQTKKESKPNKEKKVSVTANAKKGNTKDARKLSKFDISGPQDFQHVQHIGLSGPGGELAVTSEVFWLYYQAYIFTSQLSNN